MYDFPFRPLELNNFLQCIFVEDKNSCLCIDDLIEKSFSQFNDYSALITTRDNNTDDFLSSNITIPSCNFIISLKVMCFNIISLPSSFEKSPTVSSAFFR